MLVLLEHGFRVVLMDNLDNSFQKAYDRMVELAGDKAANMKFIEVRGELPRPREREGGPTGLPGSCRGRAGGVRGGAGHPASAVTSAVSACSPCFPAGLIVCVVGASPPCRVTCATLRIWRSVLLRTSELGLGGGPLAHLSVICCAEGK